MNTIKIKLSVLALSVLLSSSAIAQIAGWFHPDGTLHYYETVVEMSGVTWQEAHEAAMANGGYLVTITSQEENDFVFDLIDDDMYWFERANGILEGPWTGGFQVTGSPEPESGWQWIGGESFDYTNWSLNMPDNLTGNQNRIHFGANQTNRVSTWNDASENVILSGYVVEYSASTQTIGLLKYDLQNSYTGYTLFSPQFTTMTYLLDNWGREVHSWSGDYTIKANYLKENGNLISTVALPNGTNPRFTAGGFTGRVDEFNWEGDLIWEFEYSSEDYMTHHDIAVLPNGNVLMIAWELITEEEAIAAGRDPESLSEGELWPDMVIEVEPTYPSGGNIVWQWRLWDHLIQDFDETKNNYGVVEDHPELMDVNFLGNFNPGGADWNHVNAIDYNAELDQIMLSSRNQNELWVIDHSTTTEEATSHTGGNSGMGGDILYRWGNPQAYRAGTADDQKFFGQHNTQWIKPGLPGAGNILVYNNGNQRPEGSYSTVEEIVPQYNENGNNYIMPQNGEAFGPEEPIWVYTASPPTSLYTAGLGGAERQPNGNTLICAGFTGKFYEVTPASEIVWHYINPVTAPGTLIQGEPPPPGNGKAVFRATRYSSDFPGFVGRDLRPGYFLEIYPSLSPVAIQMTPLVPQIIIPVQGGNLEFGVYLENTGANSQSFDTWIDIAYEGGEPTTLLQREFVSFPSGGSINRPDAFYPIPGDYEAGTYDFMGNVGNYPDDVWVTSGFMFEKAGDSEGIAFQPWPVGDAQNPFDDVLEEGESLPAQFMLLDNYPNPFNPSTTISFSLPEANRVALSVYDVSGRLVAELVNGFRSAGSHEVTFDATNLASGVYLYQLDSGNFTASGKMMLIK